MSKHESVHKFNARRALVAQIEAAQRRVRYDLMDIKRRLLLGHDVDPEVLADLKERTDAIIRIVETYIESD